MRVGDVLSTSAIVVSSSTTTSMIVVEATISIEVAVSSIMIRLIVTIGRASSYVATIGSSRGDESSHGRRFGVAFVLIFLKE